MVHPKSKVKVDSLDDFASRRTFHSKVITGGRDASIRETIDDHLVPFSFAGEMRSALNLLFYGWVPCALMSFTAGWSMTGSIAGWISWYIFWNLFFHLGNARFVNWIIQSDSFLKIYIITFIWFLTSDIVLRILFKASFILMSVYMPLAWIFLSCLFRYFYGRCDLIKIHVYWIWTFQTVVCFGVLLVLIQSSHFLWIPWFLLFAEMTSRYVFSIVFKDDVYLEALLYCSIMHTSMYEFIRFNNLC